MTNNFHVTENGPKPCTANIQDCPLKDGDGKHFESKEEAQKHFESKNKNSVFQKLKKTKKDPDTEHIRSADKRIKDAEKDLRNRDARQFNETAYQQILNEVTTEEFEEMAAVETSLRQSGIGYLATHEGADRVVGVSYSGDYRAEEEFGLAAISKGLDEGTIDINDVEYFEVDDGHGILTIRGERSYDYENDRKKSINTTISRFMDYETSNEVKNRWKTDSKYRNKKVSEIREEFKGKIKPLPTKRDDLIKAISVYENGSTKDKITPPTGEFHYGKALAIISDNEAMKATMSKAKEAHNNGSLRVGSSSNPFSNGVVFYDDRDIDRTDKIDAIREEEATKHANEKIKESSAKLNERGRVYYVGAAVGGDLENLKDAQYWVNYAPNRDQKMTGRPAARENRQIFGYFSRDEINDMSNGDFSEAVRRENEKN